MEINDKNEENRESNKAKQKIMHRRIIGIKNSVRLETIAWPIKRIKECAMCMTLADKVNTCQPQCGPAGSVFCQDGSSVLYLNTICGSKHFSSSMCYVHILIDKMEWYAHWTVDILFTVDGLTVDSIEDWRLKIDVWLWQCGTVDAIEWHNRNCAYNMHTHCWYKV